MIEAAAAGVGGVGGRRRLEAFTQHALERWLERGEGEKSGRARREVVARGMRELWRVMKGAGLAEVREDGVEVWAHGEWRLLAREWCVLTVYREERHERRLERRERRRVRMRGEWSGGGGG